MIVEEINDLHVLCSQHTKKQLKEVLKAGANLSDSDVDEALSSLIDLHSSCSTPLSTEYTRKQFFLKNFSYVHPQPIHLGTDDKRSDRYLQYIPLKEILKAMLNDPVVRKDMRVFSKMFSDLRELKDHGLVTSSGHTVRATVLCIVGDSLGSHCIGGYAENFSTSSHCCRYCLAPRQDMDKVSVESPVRTVESYKEAVQLLQDSQTTVNGVKFDSLFSGFKYFHVCQPGLPPCIGHDI